MDFAAIHFISCAWVHVSVCLTVFSVRGCRPNAYSLFCTGVFVSCRVVSCQILMDSEKREIYDKLGPEAAASKHPFNENTMLIEVRSEHVCQLQGFWRRTPLQIKHQAVPETNGSCQGAESRRMCVLYDIPLNELWCV